MYLSISEMEVHGSVGEGVALSVRVVVLEWRVVHLGETLPVGYVVGFML